MDSSTLQGQPQESFAELQNVSQICQLCHEKLIGPFLSCKSCEKPYHTNCAKTLSTEDSWLCPTCDRNTALSIHPSSSVHSSIGSSNTVSRRKAIELKRLEEERELSIRRDEEYLRKKYEILRQLEEANEEAELADIPNHEIDLTNNVEADPNVIPLNNSKHMPQVFNNITAPTANTFYPLLNQTHNINNKTDFQPSKFIYPYFTFNSTTNQNNVQTRTDNTQNISSAQQPQSFMNIKHPDTTRHLYEPPTSSRNRLTAEQLHARQTVPKDLPSFSGCPEEWPLFSSTYNWSTNVCGLTDAENLIRLQRALRGEALESVKRILVHPSCVPHAISTLKMLYGQPEKIVYALKNKIKSLPAINQNKIETITNFAVQVKGLQSTIEACGLDDELNNSSLLQELVSKLPSHYQVIWGANKLNIQQNNQKVNLVDFSNWIFDVGLSASTVNIENNMTAESVCHRNKKNLFVHNFTEKNEKKCVVCNGNCNKVSDCRKFLSADRQQRWHFVKTLGLCRHCLRKHSGTCFNKEKICKVKGCQFKHHYLLHKFNDSAKTQADSAVEVNEEVFHNQLENNYTQKINIHNGLEQKIYFKIIPIKMYGKNNKMISTYAFLDDGSSISLIEEDIVKQLGLEGEAEELCLRWTANVERIENRSQRLTLQVAGCNNKLFSIDVRTVSELLLPTQTLDYDLLCRKFNYLKGLPIKSYANATATILIGLNNVNVTIASKFKEGGKNEPVALKTALGWTVFGPCGNNKNTQYNMHICECSDTDNKIQHLVKNYFNIESLGINCSTLKVSKEDERSLGLLNKFTKQRTDGHYETCLLWQNDAIILPNNYPMAFTRLLCLEKQLKKNKELFATYSEMIQNYIDKGYISKININTKAKNIWYLPTFPVYNKNKPGKCRIVWDAAAKYNGISLNSVLYKGPDLLASLPTILFQFREKSVALCGDIEQMFHQVFIRQEDRHVQRFLWRNCETNREPDVYIMNVMIFGASCAPSISQYIKNTNASKFECQFPQAVSAVKQNHYVDDFLYSTDTIEQAIKIAKEVHYIQSKAGFNVRNWLSNKSEVVRALEVSQPSKQRPINMGSEKELEKILGIFWNSKDDTITFKISIHILNNEIIRLNKRPTKRQLLKILMSVYDPLGLIGNFVMYLKIILQDVWRSGVGWDEPIKDEEFAKWSKWLKYLPDLEKINIQRCYLKSFVNYSNVYIELHTFVDASENGYAAVSYFRIVSSNDIVCSLIGSKTRVAPLRMSSIPRLELMAALIGSRFANSIIKSHSLLIKKKFFWSDSKTVIYWLMNNNKKFHQFVSLRVGEILELTDMHEWRWLPGKQNVADEATKWAKRPDVSFSSRWFKGPEFLLKPEVEWPINDIVLKSCETNALEYVQVHTLNEAVIDANRFSNWNRLLRATAYVFRFYDTITKKNLSNSELSSYELSRAENVLLRLAQSEFYSEEINILKQNKQLQKSSTLFKVTPKLDDNQILRVEGRLENAFVSYQTKFPVILPKESRITYLLIMNFHVKFKHLNNETVVNEIRQRYHIPKLRTTLKKIIKQCQACKIRKAVPTYPQMAKLPASRLAAFCPPFTYTGVDYFGPIMVSVGRHTEKRYGALFTCLTIRAVHIEIVNTLTTSSCIMAIRNFICRRGTPREFYSDNGTNFVSAEKEIRKAITEVDRNELIRSFTTATCKWNFNPPSSPHMGGAWERLVRSIKVVFYKILPVKLPSEELLRGLLAEAENIVNSRPLVYVPIEHENSEALTPNHFLLFSSNGMKPLATYDDSSAALKHNWLSSQQYADNFWRRWVNEYLPSLTFRSKWHEKTKPLQIGDLVIVVDPSSPRNVWPRGKVLETIMAKDGQVRKAKILTASGILIRPAAKLAILDVSS